MSRERELVHAIARLAGVATGPFVVDELLTELCRAAVPVLGVDGIGVMDAPQHADGRSRFVHAQDHVRAPEQMQEALQRGPCKQAIMTREVVAIDDVRTMADQWGPFVATTLQAEMLSALAVPLISRGKAWGVLDLYRHTAGQWTQEDIDEARLLADVAVSYVVMASDRDEARAAHVELEHRSLHDWLTGLPNRVLLFDRIQHAITAASRHGRALAIGFVDLDGFKAINDTFGHGAGDQALAQVAGRLRSAVRGEDTVARLAGDEFVMVCTDLPADRTSRTQAATALARRIQGALEPPVTVHDTQLAVTASIGISITSPGHDARVADLLHLADLAMYRAKRTGPSAINVDDTAT